MDIQILSAISGRLRLRIPRLNYDSNYADRVDGNLKVLRFITSVRINPPASSIAITYGTKKISETEAKKAILEAIAKSDHIIDKAVEESTPNNVVFLNFESKSPNVETEETEKEIIAESEVAIEQPKPVETTVTPQAEELNETTSAPESIELTQEETTPQVEELSSNELSETSITEPVESTATPETPQVEELNEITSAPESMGLTQVEEISPNESSETSISEPVETQATEAAPEIPKVEEHKIASEQTSSDEETSLSQEFASTSAGIEEQKNDTLTHTVARVGETLKLSNLALARRLGISVQALAVRSSQPDFTKWSMTKDPEQIGWVFIKPLNKFYSVSSV